MSSVFRLRQFEVKQNQSTMKVGTDAVLLGAMTNLVNCNSILEVGSGCGVISMMLAQRTEAKIDAIEVDEKSFEECASNFAAHPKSSHLKAIHGDFLKMSEDATYDLIISNPPFFAVKKNSEIKPDLNSARHQSRLDHRQFIDKSKKLLHEDGKLTVILPISESDNFLRLCELQSMHLNKQVRIAGRKGKDVVRVIYEFSRRASKLEKEELTIELDQRHEYSPQYLKLMRDFLFLE